MFVVQNTRVDAVTGIKVLSEKQQDLYLPSDRKMFLSKDGKRYICKLCRKQICKKKKPSKSKKDKLAFSKFPLFLKNHLKKVVDFSSFVRKRNPNLCESNEKLMEQAIRLNKLESHLLKIIIPFIRIAHCTRGSHIKVKGSCIFISADISHSMSRILPKEQNLLPVCLKRKLDYSGNYIEEIIDKNKVKAYYNFFKRYNPLFGKEELNEKTIDSYEKECSLATKEFEELITSTENKIEKHPEEEVINESDKESSDEELDETQNTFFNPAEEEKNEGTKFFRDQSSIFCNKYEEDVNTSTVANKLANLITEAEVFYGVDIEVRLITKKYQNMMTTILLVNQL